MTTTLANWCRNCGHNDTIHRLTGCTGLRRVGPGDEFDGGDFGACDCPGFAPLGSSGR